MIHVYKEGEERVIDIKGNGGELLEDFAAICGTLTNAIEETELPEERIVSVLSMQMAQGISERNRARKED